MTSTSAAATRRTVLEAAWGLAAGLAALPSVAVGTGNDVKEEGAMKKGPGAQHQFSPAGLRRFDAVLSGHVERGEVPGIVAAVHRRGETHVLVKGRLALGGAPVKRDSIFRVASMTKPVVAVAAMTLVEEGRLRLDDPVDALLPELANRKVVRRLESPLEDTVPAQRAITLRDLLTFRMGFGQLFAMPDAYPILKAAHASQIGMGPPEPQRLPPPDEWLRRLGGLPLMHQPGAGWTYHTSADVLGVLLARAEGKPLEAVLRERVLAPLGMKDTAFSVPPKQIGRLATSYWTNFQTGQGEVYDPAAGGQWSKPPVFPAGGGGLVSTVDDFLAFGRMMLAGGTLGKARILSRPSVELMTQNHLTPEQMRGNEGFLGPNRGWGFGMSVVTRRDSVGESVGMFGWDGGLGTSWHADPREQLTGVLLTQQMWTSPSPPKVHRDFWTGAYQAIAS